MTRGDFGTTRLAKTASELDLPLDDVVILLACNELFVPYLSVALQSISEHASPERRYDVVVLSSNLSDESMRTLHAQVTRSNFGIGFLDAMAALGEIKLPRHGHFACETYYRLLAPEMLDHVDKAIYMDSDLVVLCDLAELYDTDVTGYLLAATRDADTAGQCAGYDAAILPYLRDEVGLEDPYGYFQAGVLVMNLEEFRRLHPACRSIEIAASKHWHWLDQDVLNLLAKGDYYRLDTSWNTLMDWQHLRRSHIVAQAPEAIRREYDVARANPRVVHYAGPDDLAVALSPLRHGRVLLGLCVALALPRRAATPPARIVAHAAGPAQTPASVRVVQDRHACGRLPAAAGHAPTRGDYRRLQEARRQPDVGGVGAHAIRQQRWAVGHTPCTVAHRPSQQQRAPAKMSQGPERRERLLGVYA